MASALSANSPAHDGAQTLQPGGEQLALGCGEADQTSCPVTERKGDAGVNHGQAFDRVLGVVEFGARRLEELEPRRRGEEKVAHLDPGARRMGGDPGRALAAALDVDGPGLLGAGRTAGDGQSADGADGGQGFAPKTQGGDIAQVLVGQLGGGVALDGQGQLVGRHAGAVVGHRDEDLAAFAHHHVDARGAGVEAVLDQFLDRRRGALHHLAGGDAVDHGLGQKAQRHGASFNR